jgi:4a-hydroxytetrahydrobiopterin dehydratase
MKSNRDLAQKKCIPCRGGVRPLQGLPLLELHRQLGKGWHVIKEHHLQKEVLFKNFRDALAFVNAVGAIAEAEDHHPDITIAYGRVNIEIWTHKIDGLTESDFILAAKIDNLTAA